MRAGGGGEGGQLDGQRQRYATRKDQGGIAFEQMHGRLPADKLAGMAMGMKPGKEYIILGQTRHAPRELCTP